MNLKTKLVYQNWIPATLRHRWLDEIQSVQYKNELDEASKSGKPGAVDEVHQQRRAEEYFNYEEDEIGFTKHLINQARRKRVPIPPYPAHQEENEWWSYSNSLGEPYLTAKGIVDVREAIRKEDRWHVERRAHWIAWLSATTGLVGALIGLLALYKHK